MTSPGMILRSPVSSPASDHLLCDVVSFSRGERFVGNRAVTPWNFVQPFARVASVTRCVVGLAP